MMILVLVQCFSLFSMPTSAYKKYEFSKQFKTGIWPFQTTWEADYYKETSYIWEIYLKNLSGTTKWDHRASSATVSVTDTVSVSGQLSSTVSANIGLEVPTQVGNVTAGLGGSTTVSVTYTKENSKTHSRTLDRSSVAGYYALYSQMDADEYKVNVYTYKDNKYTYKDTGHVLKFHAKTPYVALRYSTKQF